MTRLAMCGCICALCHAPRRRITHHAVHVYVHKNLIFYILCEPYIYISIALCVVKCVYQQHVVYVKFIYIYILRCWPHMWKKYNPCHTRAYRIYIWGVCVSLLSLLTKVFFLNVVSLFAVTAAHRDVFVCDRGGALMSIQSPSPSVCLRF